MKFYRCKECGQVLLNVVDHKNDTTCCNETMEILIPNQDEETLELHQPKVRKIGNFVTVSYPHPMVDVHYLEFVILLTNKGYQYRNLLSKPIGEFVIDSSEEILGVYTYCNLHSLWHFEMKKSSDEDTTKEE
jgi:superoxide reductase